MSEQAIRQEHARTFLPYGRQSLDKNDIAAVVEALRSDWLTTGPRVAEFERDFAAATGAREAVAVSSATAALHAAMHALGVGAGDEVIVPAMTFAASANCVVYQGGTPIFCDVQPDTLLIDPSSVEARITERTRAIVAVDYAGLPCDYDALRAIVDHHELKLVADACHSLGGSYKQRPVGSLADLNTFSFHPVKPMTTGEGGMVTTDDEEFARRMRQFRNHGITTDHHDRERRGAWFYEMMELGFNYRLTDIQCALGMSQLRRVPEFVSRRREIAHAYDRAFASMRGVRPLAGQSSSEHAYHLYVVTINQDESGVSRDEVFQQLRRAGIGVNVHYIPVHLHPFYRRAFGTSEGLCPNAESAFASILSLPIFPAMTSDDVEYVVQTFLNVVKG